MKGLGKSIASWLRERDVWYPKNQLTAMTWKYPDGVRTYGADAVGRKLRWLEKERIVAVRYEDGHAFYTYIPDYNRDKYIPVSQRKDDALWVGTEPVRLEYEEVMVDGIRMRRAKKLSTGDGLQSK